MSYNKNYTVLNTGTSKFRRKSWIARGVSIHLLVYLNIMKHVLEKYTKNNYTNI